jgi:hypothetical protein
MEWWNSGMMGLKEKDQIDRKDRSLRAHFSSIPIFHYSIIIN